MPRTKDWKPRPKKHSTCPEHGYTRFALDINNAHDRGVSQRWRCMACEAASSRRTYHRAQEREVTFESAELPPGPMCPTCWIELPVSGTCEECEDNK